MPLTREAEMAVLRYLRGRGSAQLEDLVLHLADFTFNQIFCAVDRLSREGRIRMKRLTGYDYLLFPMQDDRHDFSSDKERTDHDNAQDTHHFQDRFESARPIRKR